MTRREALPAVLGSGGGVGIVAAYWHVDEQNIQLRIKSAEQARDLMHMEERVKRLETMQEYLHGKIDLGRNGSDR